MLNASLLVSLKNTGEVLRTTMQVLHATHRGQFSKEVADRFLVEWQQRTLGHTAPNITVEGSLDTSRSYIVMSNHQSLYDMLILYSVLGPSFRVVAKQELFRVPFWGRALREGGYIEIDRTSLDSARESYAQARKALEGGVSIWVSPEGTRSKDRALLPFKMGGFHLALDTGWPILPISLAHPHDILPSGTCGTVRGVDIKVTLHAPIWPAAYGGNTKESRLALAEAVRASIASGLI